MAEAIAEGRNKTVEEGTALFKEGPYTSEDLLEKGLVDAVIFEDQIQKKLSELEKTPIRLTARYRSESPLWEEWGDADRIAVITFTAVVEPLPDALNNTST